MVDALHVFGVLMFLFSSTHAVFRGLYPVDPLDQAVVALVLLCQTTGAQEDSVRNDQSPNIVKATIDVQKFALHVGQLI
jgi:hypothetical protein